MTLSSINVAKEEILMSTLNGKKALILGGSRGIGAAIVTRLAAEGATTTFTYRLVN
jgi:NAD(P)-dependent dehydrogenase (short-subunit alcohol dehydrogenase family)